jgi:sarcosine oxidase
MNPDTDVIVVGVGSMGSMTLWRLARRGIAAIGIEQFEPGHDRGSGHGESRIIRTAYYEGPDYVPLVRSAYGLWRELEAETGTHLLTMTGAIMIGHPRDELLAGVLRSIREHGLEHDLLDRAETHRLYPQHRLLPSEMAVVEREAGFLFPELAIRTATSRATALGAGLLTGTRVTSMVLDRGMVTVVAGGEAYRARRAVVSVGPWLGKLLPELRLPIRVERQLQAWFPAKRLEDFLPARFPVFMHERAGTYLYGLPSLDGRTVKVAVHHQGRDADPDALLREAEEAELSPLSAMVEDRLRGLVPRPSRLSVCMYDNTPDIHFIVGRHPSAENVIVLGGFSGHGFKFAPVIGDAATDLVLDGSTGYPIAGFDPTRF